MITFKQCTVHNLELIFECVLARELVLLSVSTKILCLTKRKMKRAKKAESFVFCLELVVNPITFGYEVNYALRKLDTPRC